MENPMENKSPAPSYIRRVYERPRLCRALSVISDIVVILTLAVFCIAVAWLFTASPWRALGMALICGVPYLAVSVFRKLFNAPRPYELYDMSELCESAPHKTEGHSFPSRHVFSAFVIGTVLSFLCLPVGIAVLVFGALLALFRVLLGIHFIRDVLAGALIGAASGLLGVLIINNTQLSVIF